MSFNKVNCASASFTTGSIHGRISISRFEQDLSEPQTDSIRGSSKFGGFPRSRVSQTGGLTNANQTIHRASASTAPVVLPRNDGFDALEQVEDSKPNFLDLALEESCEDSDDEWEEVPCVPNPAIDRPLVASSSGFTLPTLGERSKFLTLEVIEDWQPSCPPSASRTDAPRAAPAGRRLTQASDGEQEDSQEAEIRLELELAQGLADLDTPVPGPSQQSQSIILGVSGVVDVLLPAQAPVHLELEVIEQPSPALTSTKGEGKMMDREVVEPPQRVGSINVPTPKPTVSFQEKASELARSTGGLLAPSKLLSSRDSTVNHLFSTRGGASSTTSNLPLPCATSDRSEASPRLSRSKGFSRHTQTLRERQKKVAQQQFGERYGGIVVEHADDLMSVIGAHTSTRSSVASKSKPPSKKRQVRRNAEGKRITKAQAEAEEITKICRSAKSYIVDMAAIKGSVEMPTIPEAQHPPATSSARPPAIRTEMVPSQPVSKKHPLLLASQSLSHHHPTASGSIPRGLRFTKIQKEAGEPRESIAGLFEGVTSSEGVLRGQQHHSASNYPNPPRMDAPRKRREDPERELHGSSPRKKPRFGRP